MSRIHDLLLRLPAAAPLVLLLVPCGLAAQRIPDRVFDAPSRSARETPALSLDGLAAVLDGSVVHGVSGDGTLVADGPAFTARANADGFTFLPVLEGEEPSAVSLRLVDARRGESTMELHHGKSAIRAADRFVLDRGAVEVRYDLTPDGVEQSFALDVPSGEGDLILEVEATSDLELARDAEGIHWQGPRGGVRYGAAVAFDGTGRRIGVPARITDRGIELRVPDAFLDAAEGPIVVDPLISTFTLGLGQTNFAQFALAYDADADRYCVVMGRLTGSVLTLFVDPISGATTTVGSLGVTWTAGDLDLAYVRTHRTFMAVGRSGGVRGCTIDAVTGAPGAEFSIIDDAGSTRYLSPRIGGDHFPADASYFCVAYLQETATSAAAVFQVLERDGDTLSGQVGISSFADGRVNELSMSKSTGDVDGPTNWVLAWTQTTPNGEDRLQAAQVGYNGSVPIPAFDVVPPSPVQTLSGVDVSCLVSPEPSPPAYLIAYERSAPFQAPDLRLALCVSDLVADVVELDRTLHLSASDELRDARIATHDDGFTVLHSSTTSGVRATQVNRAFTGIAVEERALLLEDVGDVYAYDVATAYSGGGDFEDGIAVYIRDSAALPNEPSGSSFIANSDAVGVQYCYGTINSTQERGFIRALGTESSTTGKAIHLDTITPGAFGFLVVSRDTALVPSAGGSLGTLCVGGSVGRYPVFQADSSGSAVLMVDPTAIPTPTGSVAAIPGDQFHFQAWHRDVVNGAVTSNFTNAVTVRMD